MPTQSETTQTPLNRRWSGILLLALLLFAGQDVRAEEAAPADPAAVVEPPPPEESPTADLTSRSQEALTKLDQLKNDLDAMGNSEDAEEALVLLREKVDALLTGKKATFVLVGAAHFGGEKGLINLLRERGYKPQQLNRRGRTFE